MASFVSKSACRGRRPAHLSNRRQNNRPRITSHLVRERGVARFVVAPYGFGKTAAALEYAETLFDFKGCFWFRCDSPCFIRDLDENVIVREMLEIENSPKLAVFDDIPALSLDRAAQFSLVIDTLIDVGCEVIVTCVPSADAFGQLQHDRLRLSAYDLLISDEELSSVGSLSNAGDRSTSMLKPCERIVSLAWGNGDGSSLWFLQGVSREDLPAEITLVLITLLVLGEGSLSALSRVSQLNEEIIAIINASYPYVSIDSLSGTFSSPLFSVDDVAFAFKARFESAAERSSYGDRDGLAIAWADILFWNRNYARACDVVRKLSSQNPRSKWIASHVDELLEAACILPMFKVLQSTGQAQGLRSALSLAKARCYVMLDDPQAGVVDAKRAAFDSSLSELERMNALVIASRNGDDALKARADGRIRKMLDSVGALSSTFSDERAAEDVSVACSDVDVSLGESDSLVRKSRPFTRDERAWMPLGIIHLACSESLKAGVEAWVKSWLRGADEQVLMTTSSWIFDAMVDERTNAVDGESTHAFNIGIVERFIRVRLTSDNLAHLRLSDALGALALKRAYASGAIKSPGPISAEVMLWIHEIEMSVTAQRQAYRIGKRDEMARRSDRLKTHPDAYLTGPGNRSTDFGKTAPILDVKLFGSMEVYLGDERVDLIRIQRDKTKQLLAMLVLERGRDLSRDVIVRSLWPKSELSTARKNFYTIWSQLRGMLELPDGTCPYLIRHRNSCSIDMRLVRSDVQRFDDMCRELSFGKVGNDGFDDAYRQILCEFSNDILPAETQNQIICSARDDCRNKLVGVLIGASRALIEAESPNQAVEFAYQAVKCGRTRDDAFLALMEAQVAAGQRVSAMMTFHQARKLFQQELGITPPEEMQSLYESLIGAKRRGKEA